MSLLPPIGRNPEPPKPMKLPDRIHCPNCKGRLTAVSATTLRCAGCGRTIPAIDDIADFADGPSEANADRYHGDPHLNEAGAAALLARILAAAGGRWPNVLGDTIEFGCGETTYAIAAGHNFRSLLVLDSEIEMLQACRTRLAPLGFGADRPIGYATLGAGDMIRDAVADTVIGSALLPGIGDVRAFLAMVYRALKPNGRAVFVVPNRRYHEAMAHAMAEALVQRRARDGAWPEGQQPALEILARTRRRLVHRDDAGFLADLGESHLFDSEALEELCREVGFATAEVLPLDPDPAGAETIRRICQEAGAPDGFLENFGALAASAGKPFFGLLGRQDASAAMLLWLTKASGPDVRIFTPPAPSRPPDFAGPEAALGGAVPRWSVELLARDTSDGILVSVGGWCLCNTDVRWIRLTLDGATGQVPVWRPRPDVHDVLNRGGLYHPLNTLCSGVAGEILFEGAHAAEHACALRLESVLANGLVVTGPAPETLVMNEQMVIAH
jgi:SAM-dependent methyltransferase